MVMYQKIANILNIHLNILKVLFVSSPNNFFIIVLARLASVLLELVSLLLPIKIILIISTAKLPSYLAGILPSFDLYDWAWTFFSISIISFLLSILLDIIAKARIRNFNLITSNNVETQTYYSSYCVKSLNELFKVYVNLLQVLLGAGFLCFFFPLVSFNFTIFIIAELTTLNFLNKSQKSLGRAFKVLMIDRRQLIRTLMDFNFLMTSLTILLSFLILRENQNHIFLVIVSIFIARRTFSSFTQCLVALLRVLEVGARNKP